MFKSRWKKVIVFWDLGWIRSWNVLNNIVKVMNRYAWMKGLLLKVSKWQFECFFEIDHRFWNVTLLNKVNLFARRIHDACYDITFLELEWPYPIVQLWCLMCPRTSVCAYHECAMVDVVRIKNKFFVLDYFLWSHPHRDPVCCQLVYLESDYLVATVEVYLRLHESRLVNPVSFWYHLCAVLNFD